MTGRRGVWTIVALVAGCDVVFSLDHFPDSPTDTGCSDGVVDGLALPQIVACTATWPGSPSLRTVGTGAACGNDLARVCAVPADACSPGWHLCGTSGAPSDLYDRVDTAACEGLPGKYVAAISHCANPTAPPCTYDLPLPCAETLETCAEPVCCGTGCSLPSCADGVFSGATRKADTIACGHALSTVVSGVLCCRG